MPIAVGEPRRHCLLKFRLWLPVLPMANTAARWSGDMRVRRPLRTLALGHGVGSSLPMKKQPNMVQSSTAQPRRTAVRSWSHSPSPWLFPHSATISGRRRQLRRWNRATRCLVRAASRRAHLQYRIGGPGCQSRGIPAFKAGAGARNASRRSVPLCADRILASLPRAASGARNRPTRTICCERCACWPSKSSNDCPATASSGIGYGRTRSSRRCAGGCDASSWFTHSCSRRSMA